MVAADNVDKPDTEEVRKAKLAFFIAVGDLSWRLASVFLIPLLIGVAIDQVRGTDNFTIIGLVAGFLLAVLFIIKLGIEASKK